MRTSRLVLRPLRKDDSAALAKYGTNKKVAALMWETVPYPFTEDKALQFIEESQKEARKKLPAFLDFAIEYQREAIGVATLKNIEFSHRASLRYWIGEPFWGKGIMTEVIKEITKFGLQKLKLRRIRVAVREGNTASQRVLEKAGYEKEGVLHKDIKEGAKFFDKHIYAKVR